jgi:hypothetical protein
MNSLVSANRIADGWLARYWLTNLLMRAVGKLAGSLCDFSTHIVATTIIDGNSIVEQSIQLLINVRANRDDGRTLKIFVWPAIREAP